MSATHRVRVGVVTSRSSCSPKAQTASWAYALLVAALTSVTSVVAHASAGGEVWHVSHLAGLVAATAFVWILARHIFGGVRSLIVVLVIGQALDHVAMSMTGLCGPGHSGHHGPVHFVTGTSSSSLGLMFGAHAVATGVALVAALAVASMTSSARRRLQALILWLAGSFAPAPSPRPAFAARLFASREFDGTRRHPHRGPPAAPAF